MKSHTIKNLDIKEVIEVFAVFYIMFNTNFGSTDQLKQYIGCDQSNWLVDQISKFINYFLQNYFIFQVCFIFPLGSFYLDK